MSVPLTYELTATSSPTNPTNGYWFFGELDSNYIFQMFSTPYEVDVEFGYDDVYVFRNDLKTFGFYLNTLTTIEDPQIDQPANLWNPLEKGSICMYSKSPNRFWDMNVPALGFKLPNDSYFKITVSSYIRQRYPDRTSDPSKHIIHVMDSTIGTETPNY